MLLVHWTWMFKVHVQDKICVYNDAALAKLSDGCSNMGAHTTLFITQNKNCVLNWQADKIKWVVRSTLAADNAIFLGTLIEEILGILQHIIKVEAILDNRDTVEAAYSTEAVDAGWW